MIENLGVGKKGRNKLFQILENFEVKGCKNINGQNWKLIKNLQVQPAPGAPVHYSLPGGHLPLCEIVIF